MPSFFHASKKECAVKARWENNFVFRTPEFGSAKLRKQQKEKRANMNDLAYRLTLQKQIRRKFYGHDNLKSKHVPQYAISAERQYSQTFANLYRRFDKVVLHWLPKILRTIRQEQEGRQHTDDAIGILQLIDLYLSKMMEDLKKEEEQDDTIEQVKAAALLVRNVVNRGWKQAVERTLGVKILSGYYDEAFYQELLEQWFQENLGMISSIPQELVEQLRQVLWEDISNQVPVKQIAEHIQHTCKVSQNRAKFIARDQVGKLQSRLTRQQQTDAGVREYIWSSVHDSRVRQQHRKLNGKKFSWDDPPVSDPKTGRRCHPGEDYGCRCVALPVFNLNVSFPWLQEKN